MAISDHQGMLVLPLPRGMEPCQGFDPRTSTALATALTFSGHRRGTEPPSKTATPDKTAVDIASSGLGQNISFTLEEITSSQSLARALNVSASADFSYSALGTQGSASLETEFTSTKSFNGFSTSLLVRVKIENSAVYFDGIAIKAEIRDIPDAPDKLSLFHERYGTHYLSGYIGGGSLYGLITITAETQEEASALSTKISGSLSTFTAKGGISQELKSELAKASESKKVSVSVRMTGGEGQEIQTGVLELIEYARKFSAVVQKSPVWTHGIFRQYLGNVLFPGGDDKKEKDEFSGALGDAFESLALYYVSARDAAAELDFVLSRFDDFREIRGLAKEQREERRTLLQQERESLDRKIRDMHFDGKALRRARDYGELGSVLTRYTDKSEKISNRKELDALLRTFPFKYRKSRLIPAIGFGKPMKNIAIAYGKPSLGDDRYAKPYHDISIEINGLSKGDLVVVHFQNSNERTNVYDTDALLKQSGGDAVVEPLGTNRTYASTVGGRYPSQLTQGVTWLAYYRVLSPGDARIALYGRSPGRHGIKSFVMFSEVIRA